MVINFSINEDGLSNEPILQFLENQNSFKYIPLEEFYNSNAFQILILKKNITKKDLEILLNKINKDNIKIFAHKSSRDLIQSKYKPIFYPIDIFLFEKNIQIFNQINISFFDIYLTQDSFLINTSNKKKIHVTEKEYEIIYIFFKEKKVKKNKINEEILNLQADVDTKSVEAHLSRIRNKFAFIESSLTIISNNESCLEIKKLI